MFDDEEDLELETQAAADHRRQRQPLVPSPLRTGKAAPAHKPYSPQFSEMAVVSVRRLAWALDIQMPAAVDHMVRSMLAVHDSGFICRCCRDKSKCNKCVFSLPAVTSPELEL
ncbi:MAG: SARP family transcriptional regulator [Treponema sp.]|jgi:hypothetical protein|nr:SARP family transcriptional regulator [Treponema sp.]